MANARTTLLAGFTSVRNVGAGGYTDVDLRDAINAGQVPGPHMLVSGPALGITGGHCDDNLLPLRYHMVGDGVADGIAEVQHKVRENIKYGSDLIKICATGGVLSKGDDPQASQYILEEMQATRAVVVRSPGDRPAPRGRSCQHCARCSRTSARGDQDLLDK